MNNRKRSHYSVPDNQAREVSQFDRIISAVVLSAGLLTVMAALISLFA